MGTNDLRYDSTSGELVYASSGELTRACCDACALCSGSTPCEFTVQVSGHTSCGCLGPLTGSGYDYRLDSTWSPGVITLSQDSGLPCRWTGSGGSVTIGIYSGTGCSTSVTSLFLTTQYELTLVSNKWELRVFTATDPTYGAFTLWYGEDTSGTTPLDCTGNFTITNPYDAFDCNAGAGLTFGGTATLDGTP